MRHRSAHYCAGCPYLSHARTGTPRGRIATGRGAGLSRAARSREPREDTPGRRAGRPGNRPLPTHSARHPTPHGHPPGTLRADSAEFQGRGHPRRDGPPGLLAPRARPARGHARRDRAAPAAPEGAGIAHGRRRPPRRRREGPQRPAQERMEESRERQKETKLRRLRERQERAEAWRDRKGREILYLGEGVSAGLEVDRDRRRQAPRPRPARADERRASWPTRWGSPSPRSGS